ncbi:MAG TPA: metalloregulator ArsR/SmtB family transcription factor [Pseudolysinimonas sp.]|nr:metalloregulator ArsR/SmtB family transcription factor [Pseudolysinimonas sp.]
MADIFDVLADGTRRELLSRLHQHARQSGHAEVSVGELVAELGVSQPTVSKHLKVLRDHGLVSVREEGQHRYYRLDTDPLDTVSEWLAPFGGGETATASRRPARVVSDAAVGPTALGAWAGADTGDRVGRAAAEAAHSARTALEAAQEKLQGAQRRVADKLPRRGGWHR